jgi:outer membrane lipoprotein-sorting protein
MNAYKFFDFKTSIFLLQLLCFTSVFAAQKKTETVMSKTLSRYSDAAGVRAQFIKTDAKKTLGTKKSVLGEMQYSDNKINIVLAGEIKTEIIFNGNNLWLIEYPDLDFDPKGKRKVTEIKDHKPVLAQQIVGLFQKPEQFIKKFKIISEKNEGKIKIVSFQSKDKAIQNFDVEFSIAKLLINSIRFTDDVQTETKIEFKETEFLKIAPQGIFNYKRKKDDEVL